jgi:hypothetical protein
MFYKFIEELVINLTESEGIIRSPEYPNNYTHSLDYTWNILAPDDKLILLQFNNFDTEAKNVILSIIEVLKNKGLIIL